MTWTSIVSFTFPFSDFDEAVTDDKHVLMTSQDMEGRRSLHVFNRFTRAWLPPIAFPSPFCDCWNDKFSVEMIGILGCSSFVMLCLNASSEETFLQFFSFDDKTIVPTKRIEMPSIYQYDVHFFPETNPPRISCFDDGSRRRLTVYECTDEKATKLFSVNVEHMQFIMYEMFHNDQFYLLRRIDANVELYLCTTEGKLELITTQNRCAAPRNELEMYEAQGVTQVQVYSHGAQLVINLFLLNGVVTNTFDVVTRNWTSRSICNLRLITYWEYRVRRFSVANEVLVHSEIPEEQEPTSTERRMDDSHYLGMTMIWNLPPALSGIAQTAVHRHMPKETAAKLARQTTITSSTQLIQFLFQA